MEYNERIKELIIRHLLEISNEDEELRLHEWLHKNPEHNNFLEKIRSGLQIEKEGEIFYSIQEEEKWKEISQQLKYVHKRHILKRIAVIAASILLPIGISVYFLLPPYNHVTKQNSDIPSIAFDQVPAGEAVLLLANGDMENLTKKSEKEIKIDDNNSIRNANRTLHYNSCQGYKHTNADIQYHTLRTSHGANYQLILNDGTKVWMNACSELKYPIQFSGKTRKVFLEGEAYFEVSTDSSHIFQVVTDNFSVQAYGTSFNVNTHKSASDETILVKGSIGIKPEFSEKEIMLKPGEIAKFNKKGKASIKIRKTEIYPYTAWKDGYIAFEEETLEEIMSMLKRWYNVEVVFKTDWVRNIKFTGCIERFDYVQNILDAMHEIAGIHFTLSGRTIYVS